MNIRFVQITIEPQTWVGPNEQALRVRVVQYGAEELNYQVPMPLDDSQSVLDQIFEHAKALLVAMSNEQADALRVKPAQVTRAFKE